MSVFAGFWVDGAVRKPERKHASRYGSVFVSRKDESDILTVIYNSGIEWDSVYWLDTTSRESLTPEELFSVVKTLWPNATNVRPDGNGWWEASVGLEETLIDWGNFTQYPPPVEPQWIEVTRDNVGQYLFRECRTQNNDITYFGRIVGWCIEDDCCLVESDYQTEEPILKWDVVEVQNASFT